MQKFQPFGENLGRKTPFGEKSGRKKGPKTPTKTIWISAVDQSKKQGEFR